MVRVMVKQFKVRIDEAGKQRTVTINTSSAESAKFIAEGLTNEGKVIDVSEC